MASIKPILICTDLDRTLLPNGPQQESAQARPLFHKLVAHPEVTLVYVSGRDQRLLLQAIAEYDLPVPDFAIGDVGTTIYSISAQHWHNWSAWQDEISTDWCDCTNQDLAAQLADIDSLTLQEVEKQNNFKLSYYAPIAIDASALLNEIRLRLDKLSVKTNLIWSIDEQNHTGLLDILPNSANKLHAIRFLQQQQGHAIDRTLFAGDSGNDLEVLCSEVPAVLVHNAQQEVVDAAISLARQSGHEQQLYMARGGIFGLNGHYAAGIIEGVLHYYPEYRALLES